MELLRMKMARARQHYVTTMRRKIFTRWRISSFISDRKQIGCFQVQSTYFCPMYQYVAVVDKHLASFSVQLPDSCPRLCVPQEGKNGGWLCQAGGYGKPGNALEIVPGMVGRLQGMYVHQYT